MIYNDITQSLQRL